MKTPLPQARILPTRFSTACKVTVNFDPHFERTKKGRLPLLTPNDNYENSGFYLKSDTPCREIPTFLRLRRYRGMRHTGKVGIALFLGVPGKSSDFLGKGGAAGCMSFRARAEAKESELATTRVAHRSKQGKNIYFSRREPNGRLALR